MGHDDGQDMPRGSIVEWTIDEVADYIDSLGLGQYHETFLGMFIVAFTGCHQSVGIGD